MIKLTEAQRQTALALAKLTKSVPQKAFFTVEEIRNERLYELGKEERNQTYFRTTQNALRQLNRLVPMLTTSNAIGWKLTDVGRVMARSQLGVET
jgi:uncharacterized protein YkwD